MGAIPRDHMLYLITNPIDSNIQKQMNLVTIITLIEFKFILHSISM